MASRGLVSPAQMEASRQIERERELLVRKVVCPQCVDPDKHCGQIDEPCWGETFRSRKIDQFVYKDLIFSHLGRYKLAVAVGLVPPLRGSRP